ncbi:MAG: malonyl-CoA decarboxylase [Burkholderiaceae bacterium]|nr:malonyl-CoA decarboxylase [Rhodoferax sp.]MCB2042796.1 malonyl-CoA decarboxylase [Rhodoferax sp.]MCP5260756.1 malonyl-CoA decarboxylase [Rhodoferax sp.]MCW5630696.1 malonyl-CoA decarboxylase [Rhodoferax sp.]MCW5642187.1 malonyl-CoA decarboxylase [Rhodoferax sp.]
MTTSNWILDKVSRLMSQVQAEAQAEQAKTTSGSGPARSLDARLDGVVRKGDEALSPRELRRILGELQSVVDSRVSEAEAGRRASVIAQWYEKASAPERIDCMFLMNDKFAHDPQTMQAARAEYEAAQGTPEQGHAEIRLRQALESPRTRLLQRFAGFAQGLRFLVNLRAELLPLLRTHKGLVALDAELESLFSNWFDVAFLELRRISWDSPASLIEKLIRYEAVHAIRSWADVKNRLDSDRRCYGFFHPHMPDEPLIFVEVALLDQMADSMAPLLDESASAADLDKATTAIFYSISNTQVGLRGVSFGDSLIKRVVEALQGEFPRLKTFATLSPIPGLRAWLGRNIDAMLDKAGVKARQRLAQALAVEPDALTGEAVLAGFDAAAELDEKSPVRRLLLQCAAQYLLETGKGGRSVDPVARFHLGNGARIERLNWMADGSPKGIKQSCGLMVNYLYDLKRLDKYRSQLEQGKIPTSSALDALAF